MSKITTFFSYHPAKIHPSRDPACVDVVESHFVMVWRYLTGQLAPKIIEAVPMVGEPLPSELPYKIALDIETYGILEGVEQTVFHPMKAKIIDGVDFADQIKTVSIGYWGKDNQIRTHQYIYSEESHRQMVEDALTRICATKGTIIGHNIKFDLLFLWYCNKYLQGVLSANSCNLDDTLILAFLLYDQQPEKGLKELSSLFGTVEYGEPLAKGVCRKFKSEWDPNLHKYNCLDVAATLLLEKEIWERIRLKYGANSAKFTDTCAKMRNDVLWTTWDLEKNGATFDVGKLLQFKTDFEQECKGIEWKLQEEGIIARGEGSDKSLRDLIKVIATEAGVLNSPRLLFSDKTKKISISNDNLLFLQEVVQEEKTLGQINNLLRFKEISKMLNTYLAPLLTNKRRGIVKIEGNVGYVYPEWYPIPSYYERGGGREEKQGGTIQGRLSAQKPPLQTLPPLITSCLCSRFDGGKIVTDDESQLELRVAALLSGDPPLVEAYTSSQKINLHTQTACIISSNADFTRPDWKESMEYNAGKVLNFLVLYRGGAKAFQDAAWHEAGLRLSDEFCYKAISAWDAKHPDFRAWQNKMLEMVRQIGYLELPTGWSRTYAVGDVSMYINEIANQPIQTISAQLVQSAHAAILEEFARREMQTLIVMQVHDALVRDVPSETELEIGNTIIETLLSHPPLLPVIEQYAGRRIPLMSERKMV